MLMDWNPRTPSLWDWDSSSFFFSTSGNASSSKSTISTSIESSSLYAAPPQQEPPLGLKLGKRTYFEDVCGGKNMAASSNSSSPASGEIKRARAPPQSVQIFRCQVEGCNLDLSGFKEYHRKHRVCESHSKCPRVIVAGQERRFCQQCSRFHDLAAFDDKKRSCRKRLSDHNARRRKPQPRTISFNSERLPSPFYDNKQQINLLLESAPFGHIRPPASSTWEGSFDFKLAHMKGLKGESEGQLLLPGTGLSNAFSTLRHDFDRVLSFKGTTAEILNQGCEEEAAASMVASCLNGAPSYLGRALSLLSTDSSWVSAEPGPPTAQHVIDNSALHCWHDEHPHLAQPPQLVLPFSMHGNNDSSSSSQFQEFQLLKPQPFATTFFDSSEIH